MAGKTDCFRREDGFGNSSSPSLSMQPFSHDAVNMTQGLEYLMLDMPPMPFPFLVILGRGWRRRAIVVRRRRRRGRFSLVTWRRPITICQSYVPDQQQAPHQHQGKALHINSPLSTQSFLVSLIPLSTSSRSRSLLSLPLFLFQLLQLLLKLPTLLFQLLLELGVYS